MPLHFVTLGRLPSEHVDVVGHLHEPHHTPEFWTRVERAMPDFAARKQWLAENASEAMGV